MDTQNTVDPIITDPKKLKVLSLPATWEKIKEINLIERLKASVKTAWTPGVGLAAIQIGVALRVAWFFHEEKDYILVNPLITKIENAIIVPKEGCLSIPGTWSQTRRYMDITLESTKEDGEKEELILSGFTAIVAQHEMDHMSGILNLDRRYTMPPTVGRNEACPECLKKNVKIKWKKCRNHNIAQFPM